MFDFYQQQLQAAQGAYQTTINNFGKFLPGGYGAGLNTVENLLGQAGTSGLNAIGHTYAQQQAQQQSGLISRGLGNTTILSSLANGINQQKAESYGQLFENVGNQLAGYVGQWGQAGLQAQQQQNQFAAAQAQQASEYGGALNQSRLMQERLYGAPRGYGGGGGGGGGDPFASVDRQHAMEAQQSNAAADRAAANYRAELAAANAGGGGRGRGGGAPFYNQGSDQTWVPAPQQQPQGTGGSAQPPVDFGGGPSGGWGGPGGPGQGDWAGGYSGAGGGSYDYSGQAGQGYYDDSGY